MVNWVKSCEFSFLENRNTGKELYRIAAINEGCKSKYSKKYKLLLIESFDKIVTVVNKADSNTDGVNPRRL